MRCPYCGSEDTQVKDSRPAEDFTSIRRRRICPDCGGRFTTFERVQLRELMVVKKTGRKVPFDRNKLVRSFQILESSGESEISSEQIGLQVLEALKSLDDVAFVRYASVYRDFSHADDFEKVISEITAKIGRDSTAES